MKSTFEELGGTYKQVGDYLLPDVEVPESTEVGFWGLQRRKYLLDHQPALYTALFLSGKLTAYLEEIDRVASKMYDRLVEQLKERDGITEELKAAKVMAKAMALRYHHLPQGVCPRLLEAEES